MQALQLRLITYPACRGDRSTCGLDSCYNCAKDMATTMRDRMRRHGKITRSGKHTSCPMIDALHAGTDTGVFMSQDMDVTVHKNGKKVITLCLKCPLPECVISC